MDEYKDLKPKTETPTLKNNFFLLNSQSNEIIDFDCFEDNLNISDIKDEYKKIEFDKKPPKIKDVSLKINTGQYVCKDFSIDLDNINEDEFNERKISLCSFQSDEFNCNNININININNTKNNNVRPSLFYKKETKKITKEDLNNIPLPVFSCIYCSNDKISFRHLSQEIISNKYLYQSSIYDIIELNKLIVYQPIIDKDDKNEKLLNIIIKNTEYINKNNTKENMYNFLKSNHYIDICKKELLNTRSIFRHRIEDSIIKKKKDFYFKGINKISKNSLNNKCLFNTTNSLIYNYNALNGFVETIPINSNINFNNGKNNNNFSNISINFNSISSNNNEIGNYLGKDNNNLLSIVEKIENNIESDNEIDDKEEISDIFIFDTERKIKKENIIWENENYDIWNPNISDDEFEEKEEKEKMIKDNKLKRLKVNLLKSNNKLKPKTSNNSFIYQINKKLNISQVKSLGSTNNSSVINNENENKFKSSKTNDFSFNNFNNIHNNINSRTPINGNKAPKSDNLQNLSNLKEKINYIKIDNTSSTCNVDQLLKKLKTNYTKVYPDFFNNSNLVNSNRAKKINNSIKNINSFSLFNSNSNLNKINSNSNINLTKKDIKKYSFNKIKIKAEYKKRIGEIKKIKNFSKKLDCCTSYSFLNNNPSKGHITPFIERTVATPMPNFKNNDTKITSSKIKYRQNKFLKNYNNGYTKLIKSSKNYLNVSNYVNNHSNLKKSFFGTNNKNSEILKINRYNYNIRNNPNLNNKKVNTSVVISSKNNKSNKSKNKSNLEKGVIIRRNVNSKLNFCKTKICINKNKNIIFPSSFINNSTSKVIPIKRKIL